MNANLRVFVLIQTFFLNYLSIIGQFHDDVILLLRPESFKILSCPAIIAFVILTLL